MAPPPAAQPEEADFAVLEFVCRDLGGESVLPRRSQEELTWRVLVGSGACARATDIRVCIDGSSRGSAEPAVSVAVDNEQVFPKAPLPEKAQLDLDFHWELAFDGALDGLHRAGFHETRPAHGDLLRWHSCAVLDRSEEDGSFTVLATMPDGERVAYPFVQPSHVRRAGSREPAAAPVRTLSLCVPRNRPHLASLRLDGRPATHCFCRPTPPPARASGSGGSRAERASPTVSFSVSRDRGAVRCDLGDLALRSFLGDEVAAVPSGSATHEGSSEGGGGFGTFPEIKVRGARASKRWEFQIGPFATHAVELHRRNSSKLHVLVVDGDVLAEATPEDMHSPQDGFWICRFRLQGQKSIEWQVFESDRFFSPLDSRSVVAERVPYARECVVRADLSRDVSEATLAIDGVDFGDFPRAVAGLLAKGREAALELEPQRLRDSYGISAPFRVTAGGGGVLCGLLRCCSQPQTSPDSTRLPRPAHGEQPSSSSAWSPAGAAAPDDAVCGRTMPPLPERGGPPSKWRGPVGPYAEAARLLGPEGGGGEALADETDGHSRPKAAKPKGREPRCCALQ